MKTDIDPSQAMDASHGAVRQAPTPAPSTVDPVGETETHAPALGDEPPPRVHLGMTVLDEAPPVPEVFAGYELLATVAQGGMGTIYRARDTRLGRTVALKMLRANSFSSADDARRFYLEARAVAQLNHPHIVPVYEVGEFQGRQYFTMALASGNLVSQRERLRADRKALVGMMILICRAVHYAHDKGVLHRDLKPSNILIDERGQPLVSDFGIAKFVEQDLEITHTGQILGTPAFMSPEQAAGETERICRQTDVWALGVMLYELLLGRRPFSASSADQVREAIRTVDPQSPRAVDRTIDPQLDTIVLKCLEKAPADRYATAGALADDLEHWLNQEPIAARAKSWPARMATRVRRRPLLTGLATLVLIVPLAAGVAARINDLDRPLDATTNQLKAGGRATLVAATGRPTWSKWITPGTRNTLVLDPDGTLQVTDWDVGMLELVPDPQWPEYRLSAELRHLDGNNASRVGLYFARRTSTSAEMVETHWCNFVFSDRRRGNLGRGPDINTLAVLEINRMLLGVQGQVLANSSSNTSVKHYFKSAAPDLNAGGALDQYVPWRRLDVQVLADRVRVYWESTFIGEATWDDLLQKQASLNKAPQGVPSAGVDPRGGIGLYVAAGAVGVRNVVLEPLGK